MVSYKMILICILDFGELCTLVRNDILGLSDKRRSGYMSNTTNSFVFASKGKYNWVGEDILLLQPMDPLYYSVIAQGRVVALEISKSELASKLPH
jgi:hypothetical protein